jgi:DNA-binding NtrC family response regulator
MLSTILIVDDDPQLRKLCRITLEASGYSVREAGDGREALAIVRSSVVDLILLDVCMPDMDGLECLKALRAESPQLKVITMSGFMHGVLLPATKHLGGTATLAKPFSPEALLSLVEKVLADTGRTTASE